MLDFSINILNIAFDAIRMLPRKFEKDSKAPYFLYSLLLMNILINTHILSFKFFPWVKLKILSAFGFFLSLYLRSHSCSLLGEGGKNERTVDFFILDSEGNADYLKKLILFFTVFSPRLVVDISELIYPTKD
ncbi:MAG: hypothetical protein II393_02055 [Cytophagales bacterium]|nr:hypothetical protein [Cytophagales bacterium]